MTEQMNIPSAIITLLSNHWGMTCETPAQRVLAKEKNGIEGPNDINRVVISAVINRLTLPFLREDGAYFQTMSHLIYIELWQVETNLSKVS